MTQTKDEALNLALEALEWTVEQGGGPACEHEASVCFCKENNAITAIKQALAAPTVQEPVAWSPNLDHPGYEDQRVWANGKPRQQDIDYWNKNGNGITIAVAQSQIKAN
jgi:hypothetical protein